MLSSKKSLAQTLSNPSASLFVVDQNGEKKSRQICYQQNKLRHSAPSENKFAKQIMYVQEEERLKLGRELHDSVNPLLSVVKIYLSFIDVSTKKNRHSKMQAASALVSAIENIRFISSTLAVSQKANCTLVKLVKDLVKRINEIGGLKISCKLTSKKEITDLSPEIKIAIFRIIQEQLNNILKHSKAKKVQINFSCSNGFLHLIIQDDGIGFDTAKHTTGIGLINISKRISMYNGKMQITSTPTKGCCLDVLIPIVQ